MKITAVRPVLVTVPEPWEHGMRPSTYGFVRVETDAGIVGFGETYIAWYNPEVVPPLVEHFGNVVMGEDPLAINSLWRKMMVKSLRWGPMGPAISVLGAVEIALWDILGKVANLPVYQLLGGLAHDSLRCYTSIARADQEAADKLLGQGYSALKVAHIGEMLQTPHITIPDLINQECAKVEAMREVLGDGVDLMLDPGMPFYRRPWSADIALRVVKALDSYNLLWMEQPALQTNVDDYVRIRQLTTTALAAGENETTLHGYKPFFEKRAIDIVQPDVTWCGGISEDMKIMAAADAHDMRTVTHSFSGAVGLAANFHVGFVNRNCFMVRFPTKYNPFGLGLIEQAFEFKDGYIHPTGAPGLGIDLPDSLVEQYPFIPNSGISHGRSPFPRPTNPDWSPAELDTVSW